MFQLSAPSALEEGHVGSRSPAPATAIRAPAPEGQGPHFDSVEDCPAVDPPADCEAPRAGSPDPARTFSDTSSLGVAISPTSIRAAAVDSTGRILAESRRPSPAGANAEATLARAFEAVRETIAGINGSTANLSALGLAVPGHLRPRDGICVSSGEFPSWRDVQLAAPFAEEFRLPIGLLSPTQATALAEIEFGAARGASDLVFVRIGADIEVAVIMNGQPLQLLRSGAAQAGHVVIEADGPRCVCGENGCWQVLANRDALIARVLKALRRGTPSTIGAAVDDRYGAITPALIARLASGGDSVARAALQETGRYLAIGLANLITLFDPEAVVVDSAPRLVGVALLQAAEATLKSSPRAQALARCVLLSPELGDAAPVLGAAAWAAQTAVCSPTPPSEPDAAAHAYQGPALPLPAAIDHSCRPPNPGGSGSSYR